MSFAGPSMIRKDRDEHNIKTRACESLLLEAASPSEIWSAPAKRSDDGALVWSSAFRWSYDFVTIPHKRGTPNDPKLCRATAVTARQKAA